ncbi:uroporphyrinogen-III synthase [Amycolatopsis sp. PS_44_ISF1]|uniref:uroporphyrinogen-III synthase n=1 Tax=Amycolatopsis sp. PS_44_ISF1 TaxID=2974917 RepID=UPI0028DDAA0D|nr:uroporphyrinogen-III synthase [Amycolatopsis sp. PS_44_ISF1]MDT8909374.1 uroporphyrinogen-III synthase [Amycolatopsis sp. PS_44_ISF1]
MGELDGVRIGVTAERRADDLIGALTRAGADVRHAPTITIVPLPDDPRLRAATEDVLARPIGFTAVTTGAGFCGWLEAAEGWGLRRPLLDAFAASRIFARGPKAVGALRGAGLREEFSAPGESNAELFGGLVDAGVSGARIAVQLHGTPLPEYTNLLADAGASPIAVQPYRWHSPPNTEPVLSLVHDVLSGGVEAIAFTSAPAAANFLALAAEHGRREELLAVLRRGDVVCACVGPVTAAPLEDAGIRTVQPERQRLGALVKLLVTVLAKGSS